jgi:pre-mRNA-splicing factor 18
MDLIEATLAKKRSAIDSATGGGKKKYIRRGDLEKQREQEYLAEQERERKEKEVLTYIRLSHAWVVPLDLDLWF